LVQITETAPFSSAFREKVGWRWASSVVGAGASLGIVASLLVAMLGAGQVPVRDRQGAPGAVVARQGPPFHGHSYERHHFSRYPRRRY